MRIKVIMLIVCFAVLSYSVACGKPTEEPKNRYAATPTPVVVAEWSGVGSKTTEPFTIDSDAWAVVWAFAPDEPILGNLLTIDVRKPRDMGYIKLIANMANTQESLAEQSYVYDSGIFYLDIMSMGGGWAVQISSFEYEE